MKVVLFCGGLGTRLRESGGENLPKPLVKIGYRPILWHVMKYYAHFGHKEFILCLGYRADLVKEYFLRYDESLTNNFTLSGGGGSIELETSDIRDRKVTFVDTGLHSNVGERLRAVRSYLDGEEVFLANYTDGLTDLHLPDQIEAFERSDVTASFLAVKPSQSFHVVRLDADDRVEDIRYVRDSDVIINGGYFVFRRSIFDVLLEGEDLVVEPFRRLIRDRELLAYRHDRFWCMDTFKEQQELNDLYEQGSAPWEVWRSDRDRREP